jgi:hypothetical protein
MPPPRYSTTRPPKPLGRPPLPSTCFLEDVLKADGDLAGRYGEWQELHRQTMHYELYDAPRSFRAAIAVARRRILKGAKCE